MFVYIYMNVSIYTQYMNVNFLMKEHRAEFCEPIAQLTADTEALSDDGHQWGRYDQLRGESLTMAVGWFGKQLGKQGR